jgi:hypothetical protein
MRMHSILSDSCEMSAATVGLFLPAEAPVAIRKQNAAAIASRSCRTDKALWSTNRRFHPATA